MPSTCLRAAGLAALAISGVLCALGATASADSEPTARPFERARIPHLDGSGRATVVDIDPAVPGARRFVRDEALPIPARGEIQRAPLASPEPRGLEPRRD
jgi:hypothetical protein